MKQKLTLIDKTCHRRLTKLAAQLLEHLELEINKSLHQKDNAVC